MMNRAPDWIGVDWGTSACRAWALTRDGEVLAEARSDRGMGTLAPHEYEPALLDMVGKWIKGPTSVIICGMAGSRQGWAEAPYTPVPCQPDALKTVTVPTNDPRLRATIVGGVMQTHPPDVMRGEETQIAGFLSRNPGFDGVLCLPGTHTKWTQISAREIVSFRTFMTGEIFALLSTRSVLRHSVSDGWNAAAFVDAVGEGLSRPESVAGKLFSIRADALLSGHDGATARARLSGYLVGAELAASRPYWLGQNVTIIGAADLSAAYEEALSAQGLQPVRADGDEMTRAGLAFILRRQEVHE